MKRLVKKHPLAIRWFHWINFPVLTLMIWSGLCIYWANDIYSIGPTFQMGKVHLPIHLFPDQFYTTLSLDKHLAEGMAWHFFLMWFFGINGLLYVLYTAFSGEWRYLLPNRYSVKEALQVTLHDLHLSRYEPPRRKFNGAQQIAYTSIILMGDGIAGDRDCHLQACSVRLDHGALRGVFSGTFFPLLADDGLLRLFPGPRRAGGKNRVE